MRNIKKRMLVFLSVLLLIIIPCTVFAGDKKEAEIISLLEERGGGGNECYQYVKNIQQPNNYSCGMTNVLQALYGMGYQNNVPGNTDEAKIQTLNIEYNVNTQGFTYVYQIRDALNKYISSITTYSYTEMTHIDMIDFEQMIATSLTNGKPFILQANTASLNYYNGVSNDHFLCIDYINRTTDIVRIVDCHSNSAYYGIHYVTLQEAYNAVISSYGKYIIH
ncbi:MAG: hypothetical protein ACI4EN_10850 [Butyrivibrio sp.]